ncbi:PREDICTED: uncharacterized protein LOC106895013 isoform X2 [Calidris pugnax]|nr:PREDICTED: uncharacterized protein LOC106895013 isoform X2 [Calidris pugnax]
MPMRVPVSKVCDAEQQGSSSTAVTLSTLDLQRPASNEPLETVPIASKDTLPPQPAEKPQSHQEENGKKLTEAMEAQEAFLDPGIFGEDLCTTQQNPNSLPVLAWESHSLSYEGNEVTKDFFDRLSQGHVTQRRKRSMLFATSTPSSGVDTFPCVSSTQTNDSSSSSKSNTQPQLKSPSSLVSSTQTTVIPDRKSLGKEILCDQPQAKETGCGVETDPSSQVPAFVPVKVKSKGSCKTGEKTTVKKASTRKKKKNTINAESSPDLPQSEERAQSAKKLLKPKVATCASEPEVSEKRQKACKGAFNKKNRGCDVEQHSHSPDEVQDLGRAYVMNPAQLHNLGSGDLLQQVKKEDIFEIQSNSLSKSPVHAFSSNEIPSGDSSLRNSLLRKETSSACALQEDLGVNTQSIRQKTSRKTRVIRQIDDSEENLPISVKTPEAKAEEQPKRSRTSRKTTVRKSSCSDQRKEVNFFGPCIGSQEVAKENTKDSPSNLKCSRRTYIVRLLDLAGNMEHVQTDLEGVEIVSSRPVSGSKPSKIPRVQRIVAAQSSKKQTGDLQEKEQAKVGNNKSASNKEAYPKPKCQRKRNTSSSPETNSLARQSGGAKAHYGGSAELANCPVLSFEFSGITDLLPQPPAFLEEQTADISLSKNLIDTSYSLEFSSATCSAALPVSSRLTDVPVSSSLSTEGNRVLEKSSVWLESSLISKEKTAEETSGERNQVESSSWSSSSQEPEIRPLQDSTNVRTVSSSSLEEVSKCLSRRRQQPVCYTEPKLNSKLRRGDPFTDMQFFHSSCKKKTAKAKEMTKRIKKEKEWFPEGCPSAKTDKLITTGKDMEPEVTC